MGAKETGEPGAYVDLTPVRRCSALRLRVLIRLARLPVRLPVQHSVELHRMRYWTQLRGAPVIASALVAVPRHATGGPTAMWLNGTNPTRAEAPSMGRTIGLLTSAVFAGNGYTLVAPDYIGLGTSHERHPYLDTEPTVAAATDALLALPAALQVLQRTADPTTFVCGFSQGGHAVAVVHRALEAAPIEGVRLAASAAIAPPLDLAGVTIPWALGGSSSSHSTYLAYIADSYSRRAGAPLDTLFRDDVAAKVTELFDGSHTGDEISASLPSTPKEMLRPEVYDELVAGGPSWFLDAAIANAAHGITPRAPMRLYVGDRDVDVPAADARAAIGPMRARGGNVELVEVGPYDHSEVVYRSVPLILEWFAGLTPRQATPG